MTVRIGEMTSQVDIQPEQTQAAGGDQLAEALSRLPNLSRALHDLARLERRIRAERFDD